MVSRELLRRYPLFAGQSLYMLGEMARLADEVLLEEDEWLFQEGTPAAHLFLILDGEVSLCLNLYLNGACRQVETTSPLGPTELLGWSAVVPPHIYKLGAQVQRSARLLAIEAEPLRLLLDDNPHFGYFLMKQIAAVISERLDAKCIQLLSLVLDERGVPAWRSEPS
jgi:CRP/FNR family cyclic AMP-dependent transcriptional regulator